MVSGFGDPPDLQAETVQTVLKQADMLCAGGTMELDDGPAGRKLKLAGVTDTCKRRFLGGFKCIRQRQNSRFTLQKQGFPVIQREALFLL